MGTVKTITDYVNLLNNCKNLVLTGAPGTGKTYLAQKIAAELGATKENGRCKMVQFHPSYDYTDFVEGLRPEKPQNGESKSVTGFVRQDGIFKEFCAKASTKFNLHKDSGNNVSEININQKIEDFLTDALRVNNGHKKEFVLKRGHKFIIENFIDKKIFCKSIEEIENGEINFHFNILEELIKKYITKSISLTTSIQDIRKIMSWEHHRRDDSYIVALAKKIVQDTMSVSNIETKIENEKYVFIIDEINRGELSKIFGELFFSIDPGYRGEKGRVATQYQNLIDKDDETDPFREGFYVPENVYIIGTMNDIDRSVESMDFAIRRRFAWCEVTADESAENMGLGAAAKKRMDDVNDKLKALGFSEAYYVGAAYFKDLKANDEQAVIDLWEYRLKSLLFEYLRGREDATEKLKKLRKAYFNEPKEAEN